MPYTRMNKASDLMPPLHPLTVGSRIAISCELPGKYLIRAWSSGWTQPETLIRWIHHHIGIMNYEGLVWWGYYYPGQPEYMNTMSGYYTSGLTIQRAIIPNTTHERLVNEGVIGHMYGDAEDLEIPEKGFVR